MNTASFTLNNTVFTFDKATGALERLEYPGVVPMVSGGRGLFDLAWPLHNNYDIQRANPTGKYAGAAPEFSFSSGCLTISYSRVAQTMPAEGIKEFDGGISCVVTLTECPDKKSVAMRLKIKNNSQVPVEQVLFPNIEGIVPTDDEAHGVMTMLGGTCHPFTELRSTPKSRETFFAWTESAAGRMYTPGGFQPGPMIGRYYDMGSRKGGYSLYRRHWGWGPENKERMGDGETLWVKLDNRTGKVRISPIMTVKIENGGEYDSGDFVLSAHRGTWIEGIDAYREYAMSKIHRVVPVPKRVREMLGFRTIFMTNGYLKDPEDYCWKYDDFPKIAEDMTEHGLYDLNVWGDFYYTLPFSKDCFYEEWGGFDNWKKNVEKVQKMGVTFTPLVSWISSWDESCEHYGITERSGSWAETPKAIPMFKAPYCKRWSCYQLHDHTLKKWQDDVKNGLRYIRDVCGCPDICWDQYVLGDNQNDVVHDIINDYRTETEKLYPGTAFSSECTLYYESDVDNTDFTWNWLYWPARGDFRPYMYVIRTLRPNVNVDSTPEYVKLIFMDNLMMNVYPSRVEDYNGSALISEYPEFSEAVKTCAFLRREYLGYFTDGVMMADCMVTEDINARVTGYRLEDSGKILLIVFKNNDDDVEIPLDFSYFTDKNGFDYTVCGEDNKKLSSGKIGTVGKITVSGARNSLCMIELC